VGALTLNEEGRLPLKSRLDKYFPQFAHMKVGTDNAEPARPIFIHDLYRHTSGFTYGARGNTPVHKLYPGGSSGAAAQYTLKAAVWDKVKMPDTSFEVPAEKRKRLTRPLPKDPIDGKEQNIAILDKPVKFDCAGSCAFSTVGDYLRFGQMLLDGGAIDGRRVLSPKTVAVMTSDHLGPNIKNQVAGTEPHRDGYGFGLAVAVRTHDGVAAVPGSKGDFTWNGANGTAFWADPQERLVVVYGTVAPGEIRKYYREQMGALVYGAMTSLHKAD
jgi:CubicO group peptidase (beta-lactamase class C family)